jgi:hypothetical protein
MYPATQLLMSASEAAAAGHHKIPDFTVYPVIRGAITKLWMNLQATYDQDSAASARNVA